MAETLVIQKLSTSVLETYANMIRTWLRRVRRSFCHHVCRQHRVCSTMYEQCYCGLRQHLRSLQAIRQTCSKVQSSIHLPRSTLYFLSSRDPARRNSPAWPSSPATSRCRWVTRRLPCLVQRTNAPTDCVSFFRKKVAHAIQ